MKTYQQLHGIAGCILICCSLLFTVGVYGQELVTEPIRIFAHELDAPALSPDGKYLATGGDQGAFLWSIESGKILRALPGHTNRVYELVFSPDGSMLVTTDEGGTSRVWDVAKGRLLHTFTGAHCQFSPDGTTLLSSFHANGGFGGPTLLRDLASGETNCSFEGYLNYVGRAFSPDGQLVLTSGDEEQVWSVTTGTLVTNLCDWVYASFSPQENHVLTWGASPEVRVYDAETGELLQTLLHTDSIRQAAYSPDGSRIATSCWGEDFVRLWDAASGTLLYTFPDASTPFWFSPNGAYLLSESVSQHGTVLHLWDVTSGQWLRTIEGRLSSSEYAKNPFSADSLKVLTRVGGWRGDLALWDVSTGQLVQSFLGGVYEECYGCFSRTGDRVLTGGRVGPLLWDTQTGELVQVYKWPSSAGHFPSSYFNVDWVALSADGTRVAAAGGDQFGSATLVWDATTGEVLHTLPYGYCVAFSPDSTQLLTGALPDNTVYLWDVNTGQLIRTFTGNAKAAATLAFSPDGTKVLAGAAYGTPPDNAPRLWDAQTGQLLRAFTGHAEGAVRAVFSPDGTQVLTGCSEEPQAMLWNASTGGLIRSFTHGDGDVDHGVAFSPDGTQVAAKGSMEAWLWDLVTGVVLKRFATGHQQMITFSPNGAYLLVGNELWAVRDPIRLRITMDQPNSPVITWDNPTGQAPLVLQQCPDPSSTNWTDLSVTTPGRYEIVNPYEGAMFYRLKEP